MKRLASAGRWAGMAVFVAALAGCGVQDVVTAATIEEDMETSGFSEGLTLEVNELVRLRNLGGRTKVEVDKDFLAVADRHCNLDGRRFAILGLDPLSATVAAAVIGGVIESVADEIADAVERRAKEFESSASFALNIGALKPGSCYVATLKGKRPGQAATVPAATLWNVAFLYDRPTAVPLAPALVLKPLGGKFERSAAKKRKGGTFDLTMTVALTAAVPDAKAVGTLKEVNKAEFSFKEIGKGKPSPDPSIKEGPLFPAPPATAFGVITVTASEIGDGRRDFKGASKFLDQHRKRVTDLLNQIVADRLSLKLIKFDK
jgi:hypothetical protein